MARRLLQAICIIKTNPCHTGLCSMVPHDAVLAPNCRAMSRSGVQCSPEMLNVATIPTRPGARQILDLARSQTGPDQAARSHERSAWPKAIRKRPVAAAASARSYAGIRAP